MIQDQLSSTFAALSDPTRRAILSRLAEKECNVKDLAEPFRISAPAITKHLKVLESAGLIERSRQAQFRPCKLNPEPLKQAASYIETYRKFWETSLDQLEAYLESIVPSEEKP
ncbi:MAG: winged helix-turn-helix transcriptional regulator [Armatimonadetes bacterium]|nr:winged helix-turn-helix transcriptional regulator [Armatimonadota bacterium]